MKIHLFWKQVAFLLVPMYIEYGEHTVLRIQSLRQQTTSLQSRRYTKNVPLIQNICLFLKEKHLNNLYTT